MTLIEIIENEYQHPHYNHCQSVVDDAVIIHTQDPEKQRSELERYRGGEGKTLMDQRVKLHNPITAALLQPTYAYLSHIYRADGIKRVHRTESEKRPLIEQTFERFFGEQSLHEYLYKAVTFYNKVDPNAWIGFDRENIINDAGGVDRVRIYPVEFPSSQVVAYEHDENNTVLSLTARRVFTAIDSRGQEVKDLKVFYHYRPGEWIKAYEVGKSGATHPEATIENGFEQVTLSVKGKPVNYWIKEGQNGTTEVPFFCVGAEDHPEHRNKVKATFTHDSTGLIKSLIRDDNFLAIQKAVHCFPEKSEYVKPCTHVNEQGEACHLGYYGGVREKDRCCHSCGGKGYVTTESEQKVKRFKMPEHADDMLDLAKVSHYHERPLNIAEFYVSEINRLGELVFSTTYNQNNIVPAGQPKSATEVRINRDLINNKLTSIASRIEDGWELAHRIAHQYYEIEDGDVEMTHPSDFKTATIQELIQEHGEAVKAALPSAIRKSIVYDIINKQYRNFPAVKADIIAFESWKPWRDKSQEEIVVIISQRSETDFYRQLWEHWDMVIEQVKYNVSGGDMEPKFYLYDRKQQLVELQKALGEVVSLSQYLEAPEPDNIFSLDDAA